MPVIRLFPDALKSPLIARLSRRGRPASHGRRTLSEAEIDHLAGRILLPSLPVTDEELARAEFQDRGQRLARQERWNDLSEAIHHADSVRLATRGGEPAAWLMAFGARGDAVAVAEDALFDGVRPAPDGLMALEEVLSDHPGDYPTALCVALAHVDIAEAWRAAPRARGLGDAGERREEAHHHYGRAADILAPHCGLMLGAPSLAAAQCALLAAHARSPRQVADDYERLITLDPRSPRHMRALGRTLLPETGEPFDQLELEARRTASATQAIWGAGAYTWVFLDALVLDAQAMGAVDAGFFTDGLHDILVRHPDQHYANLLAAYCAMALRHHSEAGPAPRQKIAAGLEWVLSQHLKELHPLIWTQALHRPGDSKPLPSRRALVREGRRTALRAIASVFADDMADGSSIAFSPAGMYRLPAM